MALNLTYTLSCYPTETPVWRGKVFSDLGYARYVASCLVKEYGATIRITEHHGQSSNLVGEISA